MSPATGLTEASGSVPGKLMIAGEYAVLDGAPALAAAVGILTRWRWRSGDAAIELQAFGGRSRWLPASEPAPAGLFTFVAAVLEAASANGVAFAGTLSLEVAADVGGAKLGLGSSAAVAVATAQALAASRGEAFDAGWLALADVGHRKAQAGRGSGYDVFCVGGGGLGAFVADAPRWRPVPWPDGLHAVALFSGASADTRRALGGAVQREPAAVAGIGDASRALLDLLQGAPAQSRPDTHAVGVLAALQACERAFAAFAAGQPFLEPPALEPLLRRIAAAGGVARTSGAGGGDCMLAFFAGADAAERAEALAMAHEASGGRVAARLPADLAPVAGWAAAPSANPDLDDRLAAARPIAEAAVLALRSRVAGETLAPRDAQASLDDMVAEAFEAGGKRLRALLPITLVEAGGGDVAAASRLGAAIEWVHNGTLVHDDIQDGDRLRRGKPTLWTTRGTAQAINAGNALLVAPILALCEDRLQPHGLGPRLSAMLAAALLETIAGQVGDLDVHGSASADLARLEAVAAAKTAPLFGVAIAGAALLLGVDRPDAARRTARALGVAFQLRDDLLDLLGTKGRGAAGADLREGKPTLPLRLALSDAPLPVSAGVERTLAAAFAAGHGGGAPVQDDEIAALCQQLLDLGALERGRAHLEALLAEARLGADEALPPAAAAILCAFVDRLAVLDG